MPLQPALMWVQMESDSKRWQAGRSAWHNICNANPTAAAAALHRQCIAPAVAVHVSQNSVTVPRLQAMPPAHPKHQQACMQQAAHPRMLLTLSRCAACVCPGSRRQRGKMDRRSTELSKVIRNTLEQTVCLELLPRSQIDVYVQVRWQQQAAAFCHC